MAACPLVLYDMHVIIVSKFPPLHSISVVIDVYPRVLLDQRLNIDPISTLFPEVDHGAQNHKPNI